MLKRHYIFRGIIVIVLFLGIQNDIHSHLSPQNGVTREFYSNGQIHLELCYKRGQVIRKRAWYKNGHLMLDYRYKDGQPFKKKDYYENGRLKSIWVRKTGVLKFYHADGRLKVIVDSRSDGLY